MLERGTAEIELNERMSRKDILAVSGFALSVVTGCSGMAKMANAAPESAGAPATAAKSADKARDALEAGKHVFDQLIFYDWSREESRYHVRAWRLIKHPSQFPLHDLRTDTYVATWQDGDVLRSVSGDAFRETWTQYDPELLERSALPKSQRRELGRVRSTSEQ